MHIRFPYLQKAVTQNDFNPEHPKPFYSEFFCKICKLGVYCDQTSIVLRIFWLNNCLTILHGKTKGNLDYVWDVSQLCLINNPCSAFWFNAPCGQPLIQGEPPRDQIWSSKVSRWASMVPKWGFSMLRWVSRTQRTAFMALWPQGDPSSSTSEYSWLLGVLIAPWWLSVGPEW